MIKSIKLDNGKEYRLFTSRMEVEVKTSRIHAETGYPIWMRVNGARVISQVISAIADADHIEALDMNAAIEWAKITPEQRAIHDARVTHGISLKNKYNTDDVLEACQAEALEMNRDRDWYLERYWGFWNDASYGCQAATVSKSHAEALEENKRFDWLANRWGLFHASIKWVQVEMLNAAHAEALAMDANMKI